MEKQRQRISVSLEPDLYEALAEAAEDRRHSVSDVVRDTLREALLGEGRLELVGETAERLIREGLPDQVVLERTLEAHPNASTSLKSVAWYRSRMRKAGEDVPSQVEAKRRWREGGGG